MPLSFENYGYETWYDYHELILGDKKREKNFEKAIQTCDFFVIIYSNNFLNSPCAVNEESLILQNQLNEILQFFHYYITSNLPNCQLISKIK